jgi:hypothetical protein
MDLKAQLGPNALTIMYPHTADGRKPGRPNMLTLMAALDDKLDNQARETNLLSLKAGAEVIQLRRQLNRLQYTVVGLAVLELILYFI